MRDGVTATVRLRMGGCHGRSREVTLAMSRLAAPSGEPFVAATAHPVTAEPEGALKGELEDAHGQNANLRAALATRTLIGQATGLVMARRGMSSDEAFAVLSRTSQNDNIKLARLAELVIARPQVIDRLW